MLRVEAILLAGFLACWLVVLAEVAGWVRLAGGLELSLYGLYSLAAVLGWLAGNLYVRHRRGLTPEVARALVGVYLLAPPGLLFLLRAMAPEAVQRSAPLVPLYSFLVYAVLFLVPVTLARVGVRSERR